MGATFTISAIIKAVDRVTGPIAAINSRIAAVTAPVKRLSASFARMGQAAGLDKIAKSFGNVRDAAGRAATQIRGVLAPVLALGAAAAALGLYQVTKGFSDAGDEAATTAVKLGVTTRELQEMRFAAEMLDVEQATLDGSMKKMSRSITMASKGAKDQIKALRLLGYTDKQIRSGKISVADATTRLATRMEDETKAKTNALAANALYGKSYLEMMPMLKAGGAEIAKLRAEAERLGIVMSDEQIKVAGEFDDANKRTMFSLQGLRNSIGVEVLPVVNELLERIKEWVVANRTLIAGKVGEFVERFSAALKTIDWAAVTAAVTAIGSALVFVAEHFNELAIAFAAFKVVGIVTALAQLAVAIAGLNATMLLTPFGLFLAGLAGLAAAATAIYSNWAGIKAFFADIFNTIKDIVLGVVDAITGAIDRMINSLLEGINKVKQLAADAKAFVTDNAITRGWNNLFGTGGAAPAAGAPALNTAPMRQGAAPGRDATAKVEVTFPQAPAGTRVKSNVKGSGLDLGVDVGYQTAGGF